VHDMRTLLKLFPAAIACLLPGCVIVLGDGVGPGDGSGEVASTSSSSGGDGHPSMLPEPEEWRVDAPFLTPDQQNRKLEADAYIANVIYKGRPIEKTVQGYSGTIYDYIKVPPLDIEIPDIQGLLPGAPSDGIQLGLTEVEKYAELWGPVDSTVFVRTDFSKYIMEDTGATSVEDWLDNYVIQGIPNDPNRLYAGLNIPAANKGVFARINAFAPEVEKGSFSVIELAVACPAEGVHTEMVGIMLTMDWVNYDVPPKLSVDVEWQRVTNGVKEGSYGRAGGYFTEPWIRATDVGAPVDQERISVRGGEQWEHALMIVMNPAGDWLFSYNYEILGYYPGSMFKTLNKGACRAHSYAEVYNPHPSQGWARTEMGSGQFPNAPPGHVAWIRQIRYFDANYWPMEPPSDDVALWSKPHDPVCYDRLPLANQGSAGPVMMFGGPGGKDPVCAQKKTLP
jgi:hypothetical protein